jgi:hypothetical protein
MPDKPFFMYFAPGRHPRPAPRAEGVGGQVRGPVRPRLGRAARADVRAPEGAGRHPRRRRADQRHAEIPAWDDMPDELKPVLARQMEVYAGFLEHTDHQVGRLIDAIEDLGDPRQHARLLHHRRQRRVGRGHAERRLQRDGQLQRHGGARDARVHGRRSTTSAPESYNHYAVGWAWAMNTPYQWTKQVASHWGGTRNGTDRALAQGHRRARGSAHQFTPRDRRGPHDPGGGRPAGTHPGQRRAAVAHGGHQHALQLRTTPTRPSATTCSTSRCSATGASTTRAGARSPSTAPRG